MIILKKIFIYLIRAYQITPLHSHSLCRFTPTCSEYMAEAIDMYGTIKGIRLGIKRILRCHPNGDYGYDPIEKEGKHI